MCCCIGAIHLAASASDFRRQRSVPPAPCPYYGCHVCVANVTWSSTPLWPPTTPLYPRSGVELGPRIENP